MAHRGCIIIIIFWFKSRGLKAKLKIRTNDGTATFRPRGLCGWRYPRQRPHCSIEL